MRAEHGAVAEPRDRFTSFLLHRRLAWLLALLGALGCAPSLFIGFHLDDYVHRYLLSDLPGAAELLVAYESPFGIANGEPATNHWQIEEGYAPWWTPDDLLISLFRPISKLTHVIDVALWPSSAPLMHLHSLLWYAALCFAATLLFRSLLGRDNPVAGLCALLYALDYTHGFAVGWIASRNGVVTAVFGVLTLWAYHEGRMRPARAWWAASLPLFLCALLAGEGSIAIFGYLLGHALFLEPARGARRWLAIAPHALLIVAWRAYYTGIGHGAHGSGLYLDPAREPLRFALAGLERAPLLVLGEVGTPPAESSLFVGQPWAMMALAFAVLVTVWMAVSVLPMVKSDPIARFFAFGMAASIVPACTTYPHSRLLFFIGLGALGLLSQLWYGAIVGAPWLVSAQPWRVLTRGFAAVFMGFHLLVSPLLMAFMSVSIALTAPIQRGVESALLQGAGRDLVVMSAPEFFYVKLVPVQARLAGRPEPRRLRAVSFGEVPLEVTRSDARTLEVRFVGGLLREPLLQLYRSADLPLPVGSRVELEGLSIEVTGLTADGHIETARFAFDRPLDDPSLCFVAWDGTHFARYTPPPVGSRNAVPAAPLGFGF